MAKRTPRTYEEQIAQISKDFDLVSFKGKHVTEHYSLKDNTWEEICVAVFAERDSDDCGCYPTEAPEEPVAPTPVDPIEPLSVQRAKIQYAQDYEGLLRQYRELKEDFELAEKARAGNARAAVAFIQGRSNSEFEGYTFDYFTKIEYDEEKDEEEEEEGDDL